MAPLLWFFVPNISFISSFESRYSIDVVFRLTAFYGRGTNPFSPICNTNLLWVPGNMSNKFESYILIFT